MSLNNSSILDDSAVDASPSLDISAPQSSMMSWFKLRKEDVKSVLAATMLPTLAPATESRDNTTPELSDGKRQPRARWQFRLAMLVIVALYAASISPRWYPESDSALYLMLADNLVEGQGYTLWGKPHIHVPPGFPLLLAGLQWVGIDSYLGLNLAMISLAGVALLCCYHALREMVSPALAQGLILLVALNHVTHLTSVCLLSDIPFMAIVWLGLWCQLYGMRTGSRALEFGSLLLLASSGVRVVGILIAIGSAVGMLLQPSSVSRGRILKNAIGLATCLTLAATLAAAHMLIASSKTELPSYWTDFSRYFSRITLPLLTLPVFNFAETGSELSTLLTGQTNRSVGWLMTACWIPAMVGATICWRRGSRWGVCLLCFYLVPMLLLRPLIARYLLPLSPLILWYTLEGIRWLCDRTTHWQARGWRAALACGVLMLAFHIPKAGKLVYRLHRPESDNTHDNYESLIDVASFLRQTARPGDRFVTNQCERPLSYLSGLWSIPEAEHKLKYNPPSRHLLDSVLTAEVGFLVVQDGGYRSHYRKFLRTISDYPALKMVHSNEQFQVYRFHHSIKLRLADKSPFSPARLGMDRIW